MKEGEFVTTPQAHIKLGQLCRDKLGNPALSIKRGKKNEYEDVPISFLLDTLCEAQQSMMQKQDIDITL